MPEEKKEWWRDQYERMMRNSGAENEYDEKIFLDLLSEATHRARAEAFREVEEMINKAMNTHFIGNRPADALFHVLSQLQELKGKEACEHKVIKSCLCKKGAHGQCLFCGEDLKGKEV